MEFAYLGRTGLRVSRVCLCTTTFGNQCDEAASHAILDVAYRGPAMRPGTRYRAGRRAKSLNRVSTATL